MSFTVPEKYRIKSGPLASNESYGNNGAFWVKTKKCVFTVIASDQMGWEHVSLLLLAQAVGGAGQKGGARAHLVAGLHAISGRGTRDRHGPDGVLSRVRVFVLAMEGENPQAVSSLKGLFLSALLVVCVRAFVVSWPGVQLGETLRGAPWRLGIPISGACSCEKSLPLASERAHFILL